MQAAGEASELARPQSGTAVPRNMTRRAQLGTVGTLGSPAREEHCYHHAGRPSYTALTAPAHQARDAADFSRTHDAFM